MAAYSDKSPTKSFRLTRDWIECNDTCGEAGVSSSSGVWITSLTQAQLKGTLLAVKVFVDGANHTGIVFIGNDYVPALVVAGVLAVCSATGQAIVDTETGQTAGPTVTDNKLGIGWFTHTDGNKYLAFCNRINSNTGAAGTFEVQAI